MCSTFCFKVSRTQGCHYFVPDICQPLMFLCFQVWYGLEVGRVYKMASPHVSSILTIWQDFFLPLGISSTFSVVVTCMLLIPFHHVCFIIFSHGTHVKNGETLFALYITRPVLSHSQKCTTRYVKYCRVFATILYSWIIMKS